MVKSSAAHTSHGDELDEAAVDEPDHTPIHAHAHQCRRGCSCQIALCVGSARGRQGGARGRGSVEGQEEGEARLIGAKGRLTRPQQFQVLHRQSQPRPQPRVRAQAQAHSHSQPQCPMNIVNASLKGLH